MHCKMCENVNISRKMWRPQPQVNENESTVIEVYGLAQAVNLHNVLLC